MRAWVVFDGVGRPVAIDKSEEQAIHDVTEAEDFSWNMLQGLGFTCQLCVIHPIPVEQLEKEEEKQ